MRGNEYKLWNAIKSRCYNPKATGYQNYGGRGIQICERWKNSYTAFIADMGRRPEGGTIDRIDVNGNYEPGNCKWAGAWVEQCNNKRTNTALTLNGVTKTVAQWATEHNLLRETLAFRIASKWPDEKLLEPTRQCAKPPRPRRTHCKRGHEFNVANMYLSRRYQVCRQCRNEKERTTRYQAKSTGGNKENGTTT